MTGDPAAVLSGRTVLVTGGAGFVGRHLAAALTDVATVRVLDDLSTGERASVPEAATLVAGDVRDAAVDRAADGVDVIFHQAGVSSVERSVSDPRGSNAVNVDGTLAVLEAAREAGARVVFASSAAVYGDPESLPVAEDAPKSPASPYGVGKLAADRYCRLYDETYDVPAVALRYFNIYGPRRPGADDVGVVGTFLGRALAGEPLELHGAGRQERDFVHVDDVVRANLLAATTDATGEAFNVATGESTSVRDLAAAVLEATGADAELTTVPPRAGDVDRSRADLSRARTRLGYEPTVDLATGLERTVAAMSGRPDPPSQG